MGADSISAASESSDDGITDEDKDLVKGKRSRKKLRKNSSKSRYIPEKLYSKEELIANSKKHINIGDFERRKKPGDQIIVRDDHMTDINQATTTIFNYYDELSKEITKETAAEQG